MQLMADIARAFLEVSLQMAPWLLFGFLVAGLLSLVLTPALVGRFLGRTAGKRAVVTAVLLGVPLPLCSCGVLPVAAGLRRGGAGKGAVAGFLMATPQTGIDSFFATYALLGWAYAIVRPLTALVTGLVGGFLVDAVDRDAGRPTAIAPVAEAKPKGFAPWRALKYGFGQLFGTVSPALLVGLLISALILVFVPEDFFAGSVYGSDWIAFPVMLLIGMPLYVCSTASIPLALALMAKGISPGAALVFLIVGPALNGASLTLLFGMLGRRCALIHLAVIAAFAVLAGLGLNAADAAWNILPDFAAAVSSGEGACCGETLTGGSSAVRIACGVLLYVLLAFHLIVRPLRTKLPHRTCGCAAAPGAMVSLVKVDGMRCDHCRATVEGRLSGYPGVTSVERVSPDTFRVVGPLPDTLAADIEALGFKLAERS